MVIELLQLHEQLPQKYRRPDTPKGAVALARIIRKALGDRFDRPFDPNYYPQVLNEKMLSLEYAKRSARRIRRNMENSGETTHLSVMDAEGNAIALTQSIERVYGSCCATPSLGFLYNNYMSAFETADHAHPYYLRPNAVPWASVAPTIVFKGRKPHIVIGSPGSERIAGAILQTLVRLERSFPFESISAPRVHCTIDGKVAVEGGAKGRPETVKALKAAGFQIDPRERYSFYLGCVQMVVRDGSLFLGVADPRRDGSAAGWIA
jgi:gamma-glutamyltranspeptidase/glutathione hydrolase